MPGLASPRASSLACLALLAGCAEPARFVAVEDLGDVDLRVVIARTSLTGEVAVLTRDQPFRFGAEPLEDVLGRGDALEVHVLPYRLGALARAFPALEGLGASEVAGRLRPRLGPPGPGAYAAPAPEAGRVLTTRVDRDAGESPGYREVPWAEVAATPALQVVFELDGDLVCPPVGRAFRVFKRRDPAIACQHVRSGTCEWSRQASAPCAGAAAIFGGVAPTAIRQLPSGALLLEPGARTCLPLPPRDSGALRGETAAWDCDGEEVAAQDALDAPGGARWVPTSLGVLSSAEQAVEDQIAAAATGAYRLAIVPGRVPLLRAIGVGDGMASYGQVRHALIDRAGRRGAGAATTADGAVIELPGGTFAEAVGEAPEQCFREFDPGSEDPRASANLAAREGPARLRLVAPGLGRPVPELASWDVVGDPGPSQLLGPAFAEARLPDIGGRARRMTVRRGASPQVLVVHGETRSVRLTQVTRFEGDATTYSCALDLERPADLVGDIVAGRAGFLAHTAGGLVPLDARGRALPAIPVPGVAQGARLFASETDGGASRAVFWLESESAVLVVDPVARTHHRVALPRERVGQVSEAREDPASVLAVLPGPRVLHRPSSRVLALLDVSTPAGGESIEYAVPAFSGDRTDRRLRVSEEGVLEEVGQRLVAWSVDGYVGLLDLETGRSTGVEVGFPANVRALFREPGAGRTVMVVDRGLPPDSALVLLTAPSLSAR